MKIGSIIKQTSFYVAAAVICSFLASGLMGVMIVNEVLPLTSSSVVLGSIVILNVFTFCMLGVRHISQSKLLVALGMAAAYIVITMLLGRLFFPGAELRISWTISLPIIAALVAGVWSSAKKTKRRR